MSNYKVTNPATGIVEKTYESHSNEELDSIMGKSFQAYKKWQTKDITHRAQILNKIADLYDENRKQLAIIMAREMGKPVAQGEGELSLVSHIFRYYAKYGEQFMSTQPMPDAKNAIVRKESLGPILGIMPWNYPHYQVARLVAPNLMIGNTVILKHAPSCPESAIQIAKLFADSGLPDGVYENIFATNEQVETIIHDSRVQGVSLTGSERAGSAVARTAGSALKKVVLELGGSDPFIVLPDADIDNAVSCAFVGRFGNAGQACNAAKRLIIHADIYDEFIQKFKEKVNTIAPGDPLDQNTFLGPLSSMQAIETLESQYNKAISQGAKVLIEGGRIDKPGAWFKPALLSEVNSKMDAYYEELFGPVSVVYKASGIDEIVAIANDTSFGLGACIHATDLDKAQVVADKLEVGMVAFNQAPGTAAETPFGGIKRSGFGRELGPYGMDEFVNYKLYQY